MKEIIFSNWLLKIASLTVAFALWLLVINVDDPVDDKTLQNVQVTFLNAEILEEKGMVYEVLENTDIVRSVSLDAPRSVRDTITSADIVAEADFNDLTVTNTVVIKFSCPKYSNQVQNISGNIENVKLNIENESRKWIDIKYNVIGEVANGYLLNTVSLEQNRLEVRGPESIIESIQTAYVDVNVAGITNDISTNVEINLSNANGEIISSASVEKNMQNVSVTVDIHSTKEIPIEYLYSGVPADGYLVTGVVEGSPSTVVIAGSNSALNGVSKITIPEEVINISGVTENYVTNINLYDYLPSDLIFADSKFNGRVSVTVYIEEIMEKQIELLLENVKIINIPSGYTFEIEEQTARPKVYIQGLEANITPLSETNLLGTIDVEKWLESLNRKVEDIEEGTFDMEVTFGVEEAHEVVNTVTLPILITKKEELSRINTVE